MTHQLLKRTAIVGTIAAAALLSSTPTHAATLFNFTSGTGANLLSASASFEGSGSNLKVTLTNTGAGAIDPKTVLTALFWDITGNPTGLSLSSAIALKVTVQNPASTTNNVNLKDTNGAAPGGIEWGFASTTAAAGLGGGSSPKVTQHYGLGTAGFGINPGFGLSGGQQFNYGIINGYGATNPAVKGGTFVNNTAEFLLAGLPVDFKLSSISNVRFQYGTALNEGSFTGTKVPTPALLPGLLALGAGVWRKRKGEQVAEAKAEV